MAEPGFDLKLLNSCKKTRIFQQGALPRFDAAQLELQIAMVGTVDFCSNYLFATVASSMNCPSLRKRS